MRDLTARIRRDLVYVLVQSYFNLRAEVSAFALGILWWVLEPLLFVVAFMFVFSSGLRGGGIDFSIYLLAGIIPFRCISSSAISGASLIEMNRGVLLNAFHPLYLSVIPSFFVSWIKFLVAYVCFLIFMLLVKGNYESLANIPIFLGVLFIFCLGLNVMIASVSPFLPDVRYVINNIMFILMFASGIVYDMYDVQGKLGIVIQLNPIAHLVHIGKTATLEGNLPNFYRVAGIAGLGLIFNLIGFSLLRSEEGRYLKYV